jgi:hypothetical protein
VAFFLIFLIYPTNSQKIFTTFLCTQFDDVSPERPGGTRALAADYTINCDDPTHKLMEIYSFIMIFVYPIGVPLLYAWVLYVSCGTRLRLMHANEALRNEIQDQELARILHERRSARLEDVKTFEDVNAKAGSRTLTPTQLSSLASRTTMGFRTANEAIAAKKRLRVPVEIPTAADLSKPRSKPVQDVINHLQLEHDQLRAELPDYVRKLISPYRTTRFGFEIVECIRKLAIVCMPVFFSPAGSEEQLIFGLMVCFCTFGAYTAANPYGIDNSNVLAQMCQVQIFFALLSSIALRFAEVKTAATTQAMDVLLTALTALPLMISFVLRTPLRRFLLAGERAKLESKFFRLWAGQRGAAVTEPSQSKPASRLDQLDFSAQSQRIADLEAEIQTLRQKLAPASSSPGPSRPALKLFNLPTAEDTLPPPSPLPPPSSADPRSRPPPLPVTPSSLKV